MLEAYSPTGEEENLAGVLVDAMESAGFDVEIDSVGNVIGVIKGEDPIVLLCGHMDTVPPELPVSLDEKYIYGRGAVDAKGPLTALLSAASQLKSEGYPGTLMVAGVVDEEGGNAGVKELIKDDRKADFAVFGEPTNVDSITIGYKGSLLTEIKCETEPGHSSAPWLFDNAIEKTYNLWEKLRELRMPQEKPDSHFHSLTPCLLHLDGRNIGSVVPYSCTMRIGFRIPPEISVKDLEEAITSEVTNFKEDNPSIKISFDTIDSVESYQADKRSPLVKAFTHAIWNKKRSKVKLVNKTGAGDMNYYGPGMGVPVITYGPGDAHLDHTRYEKLSFEDLFASIEIIKEAIKNLKKFSDKKMYE